MSYRGPIRSAADRTRAVLRSRAAGLAFVALIGAGCSKESAHTDAARSDAARSDTATTVTSTTAAAAGASGSSAQTPFAEAVAYSDCMRSHGVENFPDPELTPGGDYGYRTAGIDPRSPAFRQAQLACKDLPSPWSTGKKLSPADQQAWLDWATCIRANGVPNFSDPTFGDGGEVAISDAGGSSGPSPQLQSAMDACKSQMPSTGGLGG